MLRRCVASVCGGANIKYFRRRRDARQQAKDRAFRHERRNETGRRPGCKCRSRDYREHHECAVMSGPVANQVHFLHEPRRDTVRVYDAATKHRADDWRHPQPHQGFTHNGDERGVVEDPAKQGAARHASPLGVVVRVDGHHAGNARVATRRKDQRNGSADRDPGQVALLRNSESWERAAGAYGRITAPVLVVWGSDDWARPSERRHDEGLVPGAAAVTIAGGGHFLPLDKPDAVISHLKNFAGHAIQNVGISFPLRAISRHRCYERGSGTCTRRGPRAFGAPLVPHAPLADQG